VQKAILGPLVPRRSWTQVVPNYSQLVKMSSGTKKSCQAVQHQVGHVKMSHTHKFK